MAEVVPLLTPQGWQLITPVAMSGAATGGAVGGATGLALAAGGGLILAVAFLVARRAKSAQSKTAGKGAGAAKKPAGGAGAGAGGRVSGLLSRAKGRLTPGGRAGGGAAGARSPAGGSGRSTGAGAGRARRGLGKLAGFGRGRSSAGNPSGAGGKPAGTSSPTGGSKGAAPKGSGGTGLLKRLRGIGGGRNPAGGKGAKPAGGRPAGKGIGRFIGGHKPATSSDGKPGTKGGATGPAGEKHGKGIRGVTTGVRGALRGIGRASRNSAPGSFSPTTKRERLAAGTTAGGDTTPTGRRGTSAVARRAIDNATNTPVGKRRRTMGGPGMPTWHRPTINKTGLARTGASQLGSAPASGRTPFQAVIEACGQSANTYTPANALRVIEWYEGMPQLIEALAGMFAAHAAKNSEDFYLYPAAAEIANALGVKFAAYKGPCEDARSSFEAAHAEDLTKLRDPKKNQELWDLTLNRE